MSTQPPPQWIELEGAANVRDVGGLPTVDGRTTRSGVLLRSANLQTLTANDVRRLREEVHLTAVLDMRTPREREAEGPTPLTDLVDHHHLTLLPQLDVDKADEEIDAAVPLDRGRHNKDDRNDMTGHYVGYVEDGRDNLATALRLIAEARGPVLVHCAAGKDRTGTVVALALSLAGVTRDAVVADYVATDERMEDVHASLMRSALYNKSLKDVPVDDLRPKAESMARFLEHVDRAYGGPHGLAMSLGVDEETVAKLVLRLVGSRR
jgi:protein tyrosine/serine phosphatase